MIEDERRQVEVLAQVAARREPWPCELTSGDVPEQQVVTERKSAGLELRPWADKLLPAADAGTGDAR